MRVKALDLGDHLKRGLKPLYVVHGVEPLAALEAADRLRQAARAAGASERRVFTVESGFDWSYLQVAGASLSLFAERRLIEIVIPTGKPGLEGGKALEALAAHPSDDDVTLILLPELDWQGQQTAWFSALAASAVVIDAEPIARTMLPRWLAERFAQQGQHVNAEGLEWLADQVEGNMLAALQEVQKLALLHGKGEISLAQLEAAVSSVARFEGGDLLSAIYAGDASKAARAVASLQAEAEPIQLLLWQLANDTREALAIANTGRASRPYPPPRIRQLEAIAKRHGRDRLKRLLVHAHEVDRLVKGVGDSKTGPDMWRAFLELALRLAGKASVQPVAS